MNFHQRQDGQAAVEFVLLFPLVLVMILTLVEMGFALHANVTINNSAREAARFAAVANLPDTACGANSIQERAMSASTNLVECGEVTVGYLEQTGDSSYGRGDAVVVRVSHTHNMITPLGALMAGFSFGTIPSSFQIAACSDVRLEAPPANQGILTAAAGDCGS